MTVNPLCVHVCGQDLAILDGTTEETRNYVQLGSDRDAVAAALQSMNFAADEVVGLLSPNHCDYYAALAGTLRAGLSVTPMNPVRFSRGYCTCAFALLLLFSFFCRLSFWLVPAHLVLP